MCLESSPFIVSSVPCGCGGRLKVTTENYVHCLRCGATTRTSYFYENIGVRNKINIKPLGIVSAGPSKHFSNNAFCENKVLVVYKRQTYQRWWVCICPKCEALCYSLSPLLECSPKVCRFIEQLWRK